ncbi:hypothetical protein OKW34_002743 [Paraburkholderia youngii]
MHQWPGTSPSLAGRFAAQYVRMSTDFQQYSTENQKRIIAEFAVTQGLTVVSTYEDAGKSGVSLKGRQALAQLLQDVQSPDRAFSVVLVYDVSRWGEPSLCMNAQLPTSSVDATKRPPVVTTPDGPTTMPCGLITYRRPVALSLPRTADGEPPVTRFRVAPVPLSNITLFCLPIEKLFHSITPRVDPGCVMTRPLPWPAIAPLPAT